MLASEMLSVEKNDGTPMKHPPIKNLSPTQNPQNPKKIRALREICGSTASGKEVTFPASF
jgi:hypothetical protein